jgi:hypothetical protein
MSAEPPAGLVMLADGAVSSSSPVHTCVVAVASASISASSSAWLRMVTSSSAPSNM